MQDAQGGVVLLCAIDAVREVVVGGHSIELRSGLVEVGRPGVAAVEADLTTTVIGHNHTGGVFRRNPQVMVIAVGRLSWHSLEGCTAIAGGEEADVEHIDAVFILTIGIDTGVVPGPLPQVSVVIGFGPGLAAVI